MRTRAHILAHSHTRTHCSFAIQLTNAGKPLVARRSPPSDTRAASRPIRPTRGEQQTGWTCVACSPHSDVDVIDRAHRLRSLFTANICTRTARTCTRAETKTESDSIGRSTCSDAVTLSLVPLSPPPPTLIAAAKRHTTRAQQAVRRQCEQHEQEQTWAAASVAELMDGIGAART